MNAINEQAMSQKDMIREHLKVHGRITQLEALKLYGCMRLGARVYELKRAGFPVAPTTKVLSSGKRITEYVYHGCDTNGQYTLFGGA